MSMNLFKSSSDVFQSAGDGYNRLCFDPNEFYSEAFSIDEFIQRKRQVVPLDILRDDLGSYLKSLRSALIELINHDYGQFVNLSSNLVGLDSQIYNITKPLKFVQRDLETLRDHLQSTLDSLSSQLKEKRAFHGIRTHLQYLRLASTTLESAETYMKQISSCTSTTNVTRISVNNVTILQAVCTEVAQVQFLLDKCSTTSSLTLTGTELHPGEQLPSSGLTPSPLLQELQFRYETCSSFIFEKLEYLLKTYGIGGVTTEPSEVIDVKVKSLLHMYYELKQEKRVEDVFVTKILKPKCSEILSKKGNIIALFEEIEVFLTRCPILAVSRQVQAWPWLARYNLITNGLFPYIINIFVKQFPHIWSPSNPDQFFVNWKRFEVFIEKVEDSLPTAEHLSRFRSSSTLIDFINKWQFNVYFQLRFHNLAIELESALDYLVTSPCATKDFKLDASRVLVKVISQCWDNEKIFLTQLTGRFLKASALFIARYLKEVSTQITGISSMKSLGDRAVVKTNVSLQQQETAFSLVAIKIQQLTSIYYDVNLSELVLGQILHEKFQTIVSSQLKTNITTTILSEGKGDKTKNVDQNITSSISFLSQFPWNSTKDSIESNLIQIILSQMIVHISAVNEVPRLFRRTNRDVPTSRSDYVDIMLEPLHSFESIIGSQDDSKTQRSELWNSVIRNTGTQICQRYANQVQEVLTSVQRMEESLKRLKKVKAGAGVINDSKLINNLANNNAKMSDDDKIRKQIQIDVEYLMSKVKRLCSAVDSSTLEKLLFV